MATKAANQQAPPNAASPPSTTTTSSIPLPQESPILKNLASSDPKTRHAALSHLRTYITALGQPSAPVLPELEHLKLWKYLFYCVWMSDRAPAQRRLAQELAALVPALGGNAAQQTAFVRAFWATVAREWAGVDALRMDKVLFLVRTYVRATLEEVEGAAEVLREVGVLGVERGVPNGLRYHVLDVFVDEVVAATEGLEAEERRKAVERETEVVKRLGAESADKVVRRKVEECVGDERLRELRGEEEEEKDDEWDGIED